MLANPSVFFFFVPTATTLIEAKIISHLNECHSLLTTLASFLLYKSIFYTVLLVFKRKTKQKPQKDLCLQLSNGSPPATKIYSINTFPWFTLLNATPSYIPPFIFYYPLFTRSQPFSSISISQTCQIPICFGSDIYPEVMKAQGVVFE